MRKLLAVGALALTATVVGQPIGAGASSTSAEQPTEYVVVYADGASSAEARAAVEDAGGTLVRENAAIGVATVEGPADGFVAAASRQPALGGAAHNRSIGAAPSAGDRSKFDPAEADLAAATAATTVTEGAGAARTPRPPRRGRVEPLAPLQWDMAQIGATADGSYRSERGRKQVLVGVIDTGIDGTHPDIAPNFDAELSRNFTTDIPTDANGVEIDGPCEIEPDASCSDPADVDEDGHGTHVASTIASPINRLGVAGVAPRVTLVNLRAGQDSGYFFLQPSVDALVYAGDNGVDVVNMSFYVDPWLYNCLDNPADSPEDQVEQRTIITAMQRALDYARDHGVTLVAAAGNSNIDNTKPTIDETSPDFASEPGELPYERPIEPDSCIDMPAEGEGVLNVTSTGISTRKSYYSSYGNGVADLAAPGGDVYDTPGGDRDLAGAVLAAYPESLARFYEEIDADGVPTVPYVIRDCNARGVCGYYQYLQGTSMASPHAAGVAALVVSAYGSIDRQYGGYTLDPTTVESVLRQTATDHACPEPRELTYLRNVPQEDGTILPTTSTSLCEGGPEENGFYGEGIVNAAAAAGARTLAP